MAWQVYILHCGDGTLYVGCSNRLETRLAMHNQGKGAKYTAGRLPVALAYAESAPSHGAALRREIQIKKYSRAKKLAMIAQGPPMLGASP